MPINLMIQKQHATKQLKTSRKQEQEAPQMEDTETSANDTTGDEEEQVVAKAEDIT